MKRILETLWPRKYGEKYDICRTSSVIIGIGAATGSLGHGLPMGLGMAVASEIKSLDYRVVLLGDGECNEDQLGSCHNGICQSIENLTVIVDSNSNDYSRSSRSVGQAN